MTVVPLTSLTQFHSVVSFLAADATRFLPFLLSHSPPPPPDQRGSRCRHLLLGVLVRSLSWHDADLQRRRRLGLGPRRRLLQSGHRPRAGRRPARRWANCVCLLPLPNPRPPFPLRACSTLLSNASMNACLADRSLAFTCTSAAINSASSSARIPLSCRYVL